MVTPIVPIMLLGWFFVTRAPSYSSLQMLKNSNFFKAICIAMVTLVVTSLFEVTKFALPPQLSIWESHAITILYCATVAFVLSLLVFKLWRRLRAGSSA